MLRFHEVEELSSIIEVSEPSLHARNVCILVVVREEAIEVMSSPRLYLRRSLDVPLSYES